MNLERAVRLELTNTGFAIRSLGRLATRAHLYFVLCPLFFVVFANESNSSKNKAQSSKCGFVLFGTEGEIRTLEASLEDSHVSSYITSASHCRPSAIGIGNRECWNSRQDSNPQPRRSKRRALPVELQEQGVWTWSIVPDSNRCLSVGNAVS